MEKYCSIQIQIDSVIINQNEITDQDEINKQTDISLPIIVTISLESNGKNRGVFRTQTFI